MGAGKRVEEKIGKKERERERVRRRNFSNKLHLGSMKEKRLTSKCIVLAS